jgi:DNA-binding transcriptional LysR family regulator
MHHSFRRLEAFYWVARLGSFHAAARHLNLTQPTVSLRIRDLERELGMTVFDRSSYRPRLLPHAARILRNTEQILSLTDEIEKQSQGVEQLFGLLRIGAADSFALTCLPDLLKAIERQYPALNVEVCVAFSQSLSRQLTDREIDVAFLSHPDITSALTVEPLGNHDLAWVASPLLEFPEGPLRPTNLVATPIITNPPPSHLSKSIIDWFAEDGFRPSRISTCDSLSIMINLTISGFGISLLPVRLLAPEFEQGQLLLLPTKPAIPPHVFYVAFRSEEAPPGIGNVIGTAKEILKKKNILSPLRTTA